MIVIPAIDIRLGNVVILKQGKLESEVVHSADPVFIAKLWKAKGAQRLHIIDLDGALSGTNLNKEIIKKICSSVNIPVQVGGGMRSLDRIKEAFKYGADSVILGTVAVYDPKIVKKAIKKYGAKKIIVSVDSKDGKVAIGGWKDLTHLNILEYINNLKEIGVQEILYTDILRDGMFTGPDCEGAKKFSDTGMRIIVSGGIRSIEDLVKLRAYEKSGVYAAVVGSALYTEEFKLEDAVKTIKVLESK
ncbi:1-(5-phosphoribosyl)-5-[(5-phosphoribosylamino)methylideneamino]imidazole-4-carboxamide isomerase [Candidatus Endomicrobiellum devescovinae]|jgi:phosphoribosylformimino-5-aminoimidazole carboxamide ribotide isomerase|uniref:1-(5-phosphoribosyl)-5-[(5- phosphoribosylamino)methylideneamino]imidazole-4- carboxamide isomerase n=1 Tax=Candidatus Endomicrobiellum devescovinae TaxID=3242322 RepID=UPI002817D6FB|nr:1-(5-phosphoribosyl)-5-[(5-phosphoribosylamino)methylideneamino]imidazole-4-carboxamide isomerase [Endomicrobium sp.]